MSRHLMAKMLRCSSVDPREVIDSYSQTPDALKRSTPAGAAGWCEDSMEDFIRHAEGMGLNVTRREFNYPLRASYPEPHEHLMWSPRGDGDEDQWDGFHYAPVVDIDGVPHVVDWTARQLNPAVGHPHIEPLDSYGSNFAYHEEYRPPRPYYGDEGGGR